MHRACRVASLLLVLTLISSLCAAAPRPLEGLVVKVVDGADHSWWGRTDELAALVSEFVTTALSLER